MDLTQGQVDFILKSFSSFSEKKQKELEEMKKELEVLNQIITKIENSDELNISDTNNVLYFINQMEFSGNQNIVNASNIVTTFSKRVRDLEKGTGGSDVEAEQNPQVK